MVDPPDEGGVVLRRVLGAMTRVSSTMVGHAREWLLAGGRPRGERRPREARPRRVGPARRPARRGRPRRTGRPEPPTRSPARLCGRRPAVQSTRYNPRPISRAAARRPRSSAPPRAPPPEPAPCPTPLPSTRAHAAAKRYIYAWGDGRAEGDGSMKDLLGGKGAGLAEMTNAGPPDPARLHDHDRGLQRLLRGRQAAPGGPLGGRPRGRDGGRGEHREGLRRPEEPAPRVGPLRRQVLHAGHDGHGPQPRPQRGRRCRASSPSPATSASAGTPTGASSRCSAGSSWASTARSSTSRSTRRSTPAARRLDTDLDAAALREVVDGLQGRSSARAPAATSRPTRTSSSTWPSRPSSPPGSASAPATTASSQKIAHDLGTAVNVVTMVFGNMGDDSGTGVAFTRDPNTGEKVLYGEYLVNAQGEDVVAGIRTPAKISHLADEMPDGLRGVPADRPSSSSATTGTSRTSSSRSSAASSTCSRRASAKRTAAAAVKIAVRHGRRGPHHEGARPSPGSSRPRSTSSSATSSTRPPGKAAARVAKGLNASPGAAVGRAVFSADAAVEWVARGEKVVLVRVGDLAGRLPRHGRCRRAS